MVPCISFLCTIVLFRDALLWPVWGLRGPLATDPIACPRLSLLAEEGEEGDQELNRCHVFLFVFLSSLSFSPSPVIASSNAQRRRTAVMFL